MITLLTFWQLSWLQVILFNSLLLLVSLIDLAYSPKRSQLRFKRISPVEMERGISYPIELKIHNHSNYSSKFRFYDGLAQSFHSPFPLETVLNGGQSTIVTYHTQAPIRGNYVIDGLNVRYRSFIGLWEKQLTVPLKNELKVIPDLTVTKRYLANAQKFLIDEGIHIRKQQGDIGEFAKIRSYVVGDDPRKINWRQTAKLHELMTNEYEPEHGKYITILIDCGRMMGAELKDGNRLEKVFEVAITVAAAALKKGDYVSVLAFSKEVKGYVPPAKGIEHLQTIMQATYNLQVDASESNYASVLNYLQTVQTKRSLVLLFSDVGTFLHEESALIYLKKLRQKHVFLMIGIEDNIVKQTVTLAPDSTQQAMVKSIAQKHIQLKKREKNKWEKQGLQMIEVEKERLATTAVSQYIEIMNQGLV